MSPAPPFLVHAPGRVNLIGEHTDYHEGYVLPLAIDAGVTITGRGRPDGHVRLRSGAFGETARFPVGTEPDRVTPPWARYAAAVVRELLRAGFEAEAGSDLAPGGGLTSSAAFTVAVALAAREASRSRGRAVPAELEDRTRLARICRGAERAAAGVRPGIMDPWISLHAREGMAMLLDCRSLDAEPVPVDPRRLALVVADCGVRHALAESEYNRRRAEGEEALRAIRRRRPGLASLRDLDPRDLPDLLPALPPVPARRTAHVVTENDRTRRAAQALVAGDHEELGRLLDASHRSLRDDYEVSCPELDRLADLARTVEGAYGSRMTGGGFGGFTVTAVRPASVPRLRAVVDEEFGEGAARRVVPSGAAWVRRTAE